MWENKIFLSHPRLATGDGPIGFFRHWARQFYSCPAIGNPAEVPGANAFPSTNR
ncbi:hypothetical protein [Streptomyces buecherae]|uniref:hypothetical protein n=1 Tax=Streptomyces buecherae TaxID=2763006 RepID=UPI0035592D2C